MKLARKVTDNFARYSKLKKRLLSQNKNMLRLDCMNPHKSLEYLRNGQTITKRSVNSKSVKKSLDIIFELMNGNLIMSAKANPLYDQLALEHMNEHSIIRYKDYPLFDLDFLQNVYCDTNKNV